ncbi:fungal-specific transcription factor domain-containing protein [Boeremia exigua]|uniref:fungal-specific transcription factor domain-containing protein n=1 Tax=Boeremia exigua TaxID=749465 RepID=UPI001E8D9187|nr:fungal-specific transcription factor domain-containing protein [Boeremia exigua]KAH6639679.1 fungal-specific transcription factor domain-containing protein [Boeremia exigua]
MSDEQIQNPGAGDHAQKNGNPNGSPSAPNPRSCITCRRRKVKCDKKQPCSNCARARIECIFPGPGRAPRKSRKPPDAELLERLRRLEGVVQNLNSQVEEHEQEAAERERDKESRQDSASENCFARGSADNSPSVAVDNSTEGLENRFGRLVIENGRSRYINNSFWASLNNEVEDLKSVLIEHSEDEDDMDSPGSSEQSGQHQGYVFGLSSTNVDMRALHPLPEVALQFWAAYKENVEPLIKVLHLPTFEITLKDSLERPEKTSKGTEALLFAIYYGAVTSTTAEECMQRWGEDRSSLLLKYRFALEQALARANFLYCDETVILQAFVIFLILLRRNDDARKIWTLTGLVVRIAQTLGIHRDGSHFGLPPFEIEMRRRLWWQVCVLDARSSEDHGCDPTIVEAQFDAKMPLNVNDADLHPDMIEPPPERTGFTDMTFCLIRFEVANIFRRILYIPPGPVRCTSLFANLSINDKEKWITDCHQAMEEKYLKNCDMTVPICWVSATISRLIMSKMWLVVYHPHQRKDGGASLPQETRDKLFITSLENIEYSILLETEARTMKWGWLFRTYVQWHAIAFLLSELCVRTKGEAVERAWRALEATAGRWWFPLNEASPYRKGQQGCLWKPLRKLLAKARAAREREFKLQQASQAAMSGQHMGGDFPWIAPNTLNPVPVDQPSSADLDRLLRPAAPKLGEVSTRGTPSSWPESPENPISSSQMAGFEAGDRVQTQKSQSKSSSSLETQTGASPGHQFNQLTDFGLDNVILDVMDGQGYAPFDHTLHAQDTQNLMQPGFATGAQPVMPNGANLMTGVYANDMQFYEDLSFEGMASTGSLEGSSNDSPNMDGGNMDWQVFDDMVSQYGFEGQTAKTANATGTGHMGLIHFF